MVICACSALGAVMVTISMSGSREHLRDSRGRRAGCRISSQAPRRCPGVGEATATTSASSGMIWNEAAWMSASNCEPMIPTFTFPFGMCVSQAKGRSLTRSRLAS